MKLVFSFFATVKAFISTFLNFLFSGSYIRAYHVLLHEKEVGSSDFVT